MWFLKEKRIGEPTKECNLSDLIGPNPVTTQQVNIFWTNEGILNFFLRYRSKIRIVMPLKQLLNTCLSCRTAKNREFIYTVSQRPTARLITQRPVWATCTRLISSWNYHKRRCFTFSIIWREREHNTWLLLRSKSKVGDSIQSIWCGFKGTKSQKQSMMNTNRYEPKPTLIPKPYLTSKYF